MSNPRRLAIYTRNGRKLTPAQRRRMRKHANAEKG